MQASSQQWKEREMLHIFLHWSRGLEWNNSWVNPILLNILLRPECYVMSNILFSLTFKTSAVRSFTQSPYVLKNGTTLAALDLVDHTRTMNSGICILRFRIRLMKAVNHSEPTYIFIPMYDRFRPKNYWRTEVQESLFLLVINQNIFLMQSWCTSFFSLSGLSVKI